MDHHRQRRKTTQKTKPSGPTKKCKQTFQYFSSDQQLRFMRVENSLHDFKHESKPFSHNSGDSRLLIQDNNKVREDSRLSSFNF